MASAFALGLLFTIAAGGAAFADDSIEWQSGGKFQKMFSGEGQSSAGLSGNGSTRQARQTSRPKPQSEAVASSSSSEDARKAKSSRTRVASLGRDVDVTPRPGRSISGGGNVNWTASAGCLSSNLRSAINYISQNYGSVRVNSTCRSSSHNRRVGGASKSYHLTGDAADIRVFGNVGATYAYLRGAVGGLKHYGGGLFHIDNGPRRSF